MKAFWNRVTLKNYATDEDPGDIRPWDCVVAAVVLGCLYLCIMLGAAAGF